MSQTSRKAHSASALPKELSELRQQLADTFGTKVGAKYSNGKGSITLSFATPEEMDAVVDRLRELV